MGLHNLLNRLKHSVSDTPDTSEKSAGYQAKPSIHAGCTLDTPDTPQIDCTRESAANDPDPDPWSWPHSTAMNGAELDVFTARLSRFTDLGLTLTDAEALADKLMQRDRDSDDRRACLECLHFHRGGRCGNCQAAGIAIKAIDVKLPGDFTAMLHRCDGYTGRAI